MKLFTLNLAPLGIPQLVSFTQAYSSLRSILTMYSCQLSLGTHTTQDDLMCSPSNPVTCARESDSMNQDRDSSGHILRIPIRHMDKAIERARG